MLGRRCVVAIAHTPVVRNVQALRAVAALLVVTSHATLPNLGVEAVLAPSEQPWFTPLRYIGVSGVDLFFAISGFIMITTNWDSFGFRSAGLRFLARRAIRIYPAYWFALVPGLTLLAIMSAQRLGRSAHAGLIGVYAADKAKSIHLSGVINSVLLLPNPDKFVLNVAWTLVWEMLFYVVFAVMLAWPRRYVLGALAVWALVEIGMHVTYAGSGNFYVAFLSSPIPLEFIGGALVGYVAARRLFPIPWMFAGLAVGATAAAWCYADAVQRQLSPGTLERVFVFGPPAVLAVYAAVALERTGSLRAPRWLTAIGDASYAIYLWHLLIIFMVRAIVAQIAPAGNLAHAAVIVATVGAVIAGGLCIYAVVEKPLTRSLTRRLMPADAPAAAHAEVHIAVRPLDAPEVLGNA